MNFNLSVECHPHQRCRPGLWKTLEWLGYKPVMKEIHFPENTQVWLNSVWVTEQVCVPVDMNQQSRSTATLVCQLPTMTHLCWDVSADGRFLPPAPVSGDLRKDRGEQTGKVRTQSDYWFNGDMKHWRKTPWWKPNEWTQRSRKPTKNVLHDVYWISLRSSSCSVKFKQHFILEMASSASLSNRCSADK